MRPLARIHRRTCSHDVWLAGKARQWMNRPNSRFQGKKPAQMIESDLVGVEAELVRIDHGVYI
jgi:uncharacterized protein (DUF2384 family)